jgi:hypothetical protein
VNPHPLGIAPVPNPEERVSLAPHCALFGYLTRIVAEEVKHRY